jgi:hypothetical protein
LFELIIQLIIIKPTNYLLNSITIKNHDSKKLFIIFFSLSFIVFLFTSDAHRYSLDEAVGQEMAYRLTILESDLSYIQGESKIFFNIPLMNPQNIGLLCSNGITCYPTSVFYSVTQIPLISINHFFQIITPDTLTFTTTDFTDQHYIYWRNSEKSDLIFMELFYGPFFSALSTAVFFLICLEYKFTKKTSILISLLFSFTTILWAYSNTSLNVVPTLSFILLGYLFYKKSSVNNELKFLIFSSGFLGFSFLIRDSSILFIIPIFSMLFINILRKKTKLISLFCFMIPLFFSYFLSRYVSSLKYIYSSDVVINNLNEVSSVAQTFIPKITSITPAVGLLFSPGLGLFIFSPILLTIFFTFPDFFRKNKSDCILFSSIFLFSLFWFSHIGITWHGLIGWGPRYLYMVIPFLLIPLGSSLEKRNKKFMFILIIILAILGIFFNFSYVIQDNPWFVWGLPGQSSGLYGLGIPNSICDWGCQKEESNMYINNLTIWTFQYSQLTQSILLMFQGLQHDIYLLHLFGPYVYWPLLTSLMFFFTYLLWHSLRKKSNFESIKP